MGSFAGVILFTDASASRCLWRGVRGEYVDGQSPHWGIILTSTTSRQPQPSSLNCRDRLSASNQRLVFVFCIHYIFSIKYHVKQNKESKEKRNIYIYIYMNKKNIYIYIMYCRGPDSLWGPSTFIACCIDFPSPRLRPLGA